MKKNISAWKVSIPFGANLKVSVGESVKCGQVLFDYVVEVEEVFSLQNELRDIDRGVLANINNSNHQKKITLGDLLYEKKGLFGRKVGVPANGIYKEIDEWLNIHIITSKTTKEFICPISAKITDVSDGEIALSFWAEEYQGVGLNENKAWIGSDLKIINNLTDINYDSRDKLLLIEKNIKSWIIKASVVGAGAVILLQDEIIEEGDRINFKMPILKVSNDVFETLVQKKDSECKIWADGTEGKLLLVTENKNDD